jgi:hypothetical protein
MIIFALQTVSRRDETSRRRRQRKGGDWWKGIGVKAELKSGTVK